VRGHVLIDVSFHDVGLKQCTRRLRIVAHKTVRRCVTFYEIERRKGEEGMRQGRFVGPPSAAKTDVASPKRCARAAAWPLQASGGRHDNGER